MRDDEHRLQMICVRWFRYQYPQLHGLLFAVPNGGRRDAATGARLKAEGVIPGVADLILLIPRPGSGALLLELKTPRGRQSPDQKEWQATVTAAGYRYAVIRSFPEFVETVSAYIESSSPINH